MAINEMSMSDIEARSAEIEELLKNEDADIEALSTEVEQLEARKAEIEAEVEKRKKEAEDALKNGKVIEERKEDKRMTLNEIRNLPEYRKAYATYLIKGDDKELRKVLTANADNANVGVNDTQFPVPEYLEKKIQTNWEKDDITSRITKSNLKGNIKVGFEVSGSEAVIHAEGSAAPSEEQLVLGSVSIVPETIKKWITVSSEQYDMGGEEFMDYIYDEIAYRIVKKMVSIIIGKITSASATTTTSSAGVPLLAHALDATAVIEAEALLSDEASDICLIMNRGTYAALKGLTISQGAMVGDVFDGKTVLFTSELPSYADADEDDIYMLVGDLRGVQGNFPNGDEVKFIFDEKSLAESDLVKVVGRLYGGFEVVKPNALVKVAVPEAEGE